MSTGEQIAVALVGVTLVLFFIERRRMKES